MKRIKRIAVATGTRADWGLLSPIAKELSSRGAEISVIATNMHLLPQFGDTYKEILADGFAIDHRVPTEGTRAEITAQTTTGFAEVFGKERFDAVLILGDRFEMLGAATAALLCGVPIIHIAGGTVSYGALDDSIRHAISKMATLHLTETEKCRRRLLRMGENPDSVVVSGAIGCRNVLETPLMSRGEIEKELDFRLGEECFVATLHPTTLSSIPPLQQMRNFTEAIAEDIESRGSRFIITFPNNDVDAAPQLALLRSLAESHRDSVKLVASLGRTRYFSALAHSGGCVGNSSGGLIEAPLIGIPTLNIGNRQDGREAPASVVNCGDSKAEILRGLRRIAAPDAPRPSSPSESPYYRENTLNIMADAIMNFEFQQYPKKRFFEQ